MLRGKYAMKEYFSRLSMKEKSCFAITVFILTIYGTVMLYLCLRTDAFVPDEVWFYEIANSMKDYSFLQLLKIPNELGYGSIYWITLVLLKDLRTMRIFSWICMVIVPICIILVLIKGLNRS